MNPTDRLDAVIIGGDVPDEYLGKDEREKMRLTVGGYPASLRFLDRFFAHGRDAEAAQHALLQDGLPFVSLNGPYLESFLREQGLATELVPLLSPFKTRFVELMQRQPRAVIISTTFLPFARHIDQMAHAIRTLAPDTTIVAGGIQVWKSFQHLQLLHNGTMEPGIRDAVGEHSFFLDAGRPSPVDLFVVSPAGETTLAALLIRLREGGNPRNLPNLAYQDNDQWVFTPQQPEPHRTIQVDWSLPHLPAGPVYLPVQAGEGCGFQCAFCDFCGLRPVHLRSPDSVVREIRTMPPQADGLRRVYFTDDNLFASRTRAREICRALIASGMPIRWRGMVRIAIVDSEIASLMAESGCLEVLLGIESGDPDVLRNMGKEASPDRILKGIACLNQAGIHTKSTFIVGYPGETETTLRHTVDLINAYPTDGPAIHRYLFFRFGVLPLSRIASPESRRRFSLKGYGYTWTHATMTSDEASAHLTQLPDQLHAALSPSYLLEVPELPGMSVDQLKQTVILRNHLARLNRGRPAPFAEAELWDRLESGFPHHPRPSNQ